MDWRVLRDIARRGWVQLAVLFAFGGLGAWAAREAAASPAARLIMASFVMAFLGLERWEPLFRDRARRSLPVSSTVLGRSQWMALVAAPVVVVVTGAVFGATVLRLPLSVDRDTGGLPWGFPVDVLAVLSALLLLRQMPGGFADLAPRKHHIPFVALLRFWAAATILSCVIFPSQPVQPLWMLLIEMANAIALALVSYRLSIGVPVGLDGKWILGGEAWGGARGGARLRRKHLGERVEDAAIESVRLLGKRMSWALTAAMFDLYGTIFGTVVLTAILRIIREVGFISASDPMNFPVELVAAFLVAAPILRWHPVLRVLGMLPISRSRLTWGIAFGYIPVYAMILTPAIWALGGLEPGSAYSISARLPIAIVVAAAIPAGIAATLKWDPGIGVVTALLALLPPFVLGILRSLSVLEFSALHFALPYGAILHVASVLWLRAVIMGWNDSYQRSRPPFMVLDFLNPRPGR